MKTLIIILSLLIVSCTVKSPIPQDLQQVYDDVNGIMVYDETAPKWTINPIQKDLFGKEYRLGSCSNYTILYMEKLKELGYTANQLRPIYSHVYLQVILDNGEIYNLDSAKHQISRLRGEDNAL